MKPFCIIPLLLLLCGCTSVRFTTDIHKQSLKMELPVRFRIERLSYAPLPKQDMREQCLWAEGFLWLNVNSVPIVADNAEERVRNMARKTAVARYPELFSEKSDSIPLDIAVRIDRTSKLWSTYLSIIPPLSLIPIPTSDRVIFNVSASVIESGQGEALGRSVFTRRDVAWWTISSPLGLIPIPGKSNVPKISSMKLFQESSEVGGDLTIEGFVDSIVRILQQRDLTPEIEEYIKSLRKF